MPYRLTRNLSLSLPPSLLQSTWYKNSLYCLLVELIRAQRCVCLCGEVNLIFMCYHGEGGLKFINSWEKKSLFLLLVIPRSSSIQRNVKKSPNPFLVKSETFLYWFLSKMPFLRAVTGLYCTCSKQIFSAVLILKIVITKPARFISHNALFRLHISQTSHINKETSRPYHELVFEFKSTAGFPTEDYIFRLYLPMRAN